MKNLFVLITLSLIARADQGEWKLVDKWANYPAERACVDSVTLEKKDTNHIILHQFFDDGTPASWEEFDHIGEGRKCYPNNSSYTFGGYRCYESRFEKGVLYKGDCGTDLGWFKCWPLAGNLELSRNAKTSVTSIEMKDNKLILDNVNNRYYDGSNPHFTCTYQK